LSARATNIVACLPHWLGKSIDDVENAGEDDGQDEGAQQLSFIPSE
jgi:hypothetical protein